MKVSIIVCAAGKGERAGFNKNKLLVAFKGANALYYSLSAFEFLQGAQRLAVCAEGDVEAVELCRAMGWQTVTGGSTRTQSVYNALKEVTGDVVVIHDGARPFISQSAITECIDCAKKYGSALCATPATDTVAIESGGEVLSVPERAHTYLIQTPQCFNTEELKSAYIKAMGDGLQYTDDGAVYSRYVRPARLCPCGSPQNKKLTFKEDFIDGPPLPTLTGDGLKAGFGVDVHAFGKAQNFITLCGVQVPSHSGLVAHSDGDVAVHAVMDALLSAAGLRDIGFYFPDTDPSFKGANSLTLLQKVAHMLGVNGYRAGGISLSIQAETPRLSPYIEEMKSNLCGVLSLDKSAVAVAAGTCEGLGFIGKKLGICAYCCAVIKEI